jgi:cytochrome c5
MKFTSKIYILALTFLGACSVLQNGKRGVNESAPVPDNSMALRSKTSLETLQTGHGIYMRKCGECHTHVLPKEVSSKDWHVVVPGMAWNAGILPSEEKALIKYIMAARSQE